MQKQQEAAEIRAQKQEEAAEAKAKEQLELLQEQLQEADEQAAQLLYHFVGAQDATQAALKPVDPNSFD